MGGLSALHGVGIDHVMVGRAVGERREAVAQQSLHHLLLREILRQIVARPHATPAFELRMRLVRTHQTRQVGTLAIRLADFDGLFTLNRLRKHLL